jgi:hypothetical protein
MRRLVLLLLGFLLGFGCCAVSVLGQPPAATAGSCPYQVPLGGYAGAPSILAGVSYDAWSVAYLAGRPDAIYDAAEFDGMAASLAEVCSAWAPTYYGTTCPATCDPATPALCFDTDTTAGLNLYGCTAVDTWTLLGDGGGGGDDNQVAAEVPITDAGGFFAGVEVEAALQEIGPTMTDERSPTGTASGDLAGTYPSPTVTDDSHAHGPTTIAGLDAGDTTTGTFDAARLPAATTTTQGAVVLSTSGEGTAGEVVQADDARLDDARTPTAHAASHENAGGDELSVAGLSGALADPQLAGTIDDAQNSAFDTADTPADGDLLKWDLTAGLIRWAPAGSASFTTLTADYGDETVTSTWDLSGALVELPNSTAPTGTDCDDAAEAGRVHVDTDAPTGEQFLVCEGASGWVQQGGSGGAAPLLYVRDAKTSGNAAGASVAATWNVRTLNSVVENGIAGASLSTNQVTLPAGSYRIRARAPGYQAGRHKLRLRDITNTATLALGANEYVSQAGGTASGATLQARVTLAGVTVVELQHYTEVAIATQGLGVPSSTGEDEVYAELWIEQE